MADAPAVKPWGIDDKKKLQQLINSGKVDISRTEDIGYIDSVHFKYYRYRDRDTSTSAATFGITLAPLT